MSDQLLTYSNSELLRCRSLSSKYCLMSRYSSHSEQQLREVLDLRECRNAATESCSVPEVKGQK